MRCYKFPVMLTKKREEIWAHPTNAFAESFNAKIKAFRASLRGVSDIRFFLFRLTRLYA